MSAAPIRESHTLEEINAKLRGDEPSPLLTMSEDSLRAAVRSDLNRVQDFRSQEIRSQLERLGNVPTIQQEQAIGEAVGAIRTTDLMRKYSDAFRMSEGRGIYRPQSDAQATELDRLDQAIDANPTSGFMFDGVGAMSKNVQDVGLSLYAVTSTLARGAASVLPESVSRPLIDTAQWLDEGRDAYRELVMTGQAAPYGGSEPTFVQQLNHRGSKGTWGAWTGNVAFYAIPSAASALRGVQAAKAFNTVVMSLMGLQSAGQGIENYRRAELMEGRTPNPWKAIGVGIGYAAAEIVTEKLDAIPGIRGPWQQLSSHGASKIATHLMRGDAGGATHYLLNSIGMANAEGLEEVITGEFQALIDSGLYGGGADRSWGDRVNEYAGGAAGGAMVTLGGSFSPVFREAMLSAPSPTSPGQVERKLIADFETFADSPQGRVSALAQAIASARPDKTNSMEVIRSAATKQAEAMGKPHLAEKIMAAMQATEKPVRSVDELVGEYVEDVKSVTGATVAIRVVGESEVNGVRLIEIEADSDLPFPAYATSDATTILVQRGAEDFGLVAHELVHVFRQQHPEVYGELVQSTAGPVLAYAATYAQDLAAQGADIGGLTPEQRVEEGAARMVELVAGKAGLKSRLSPTQVSVLRKLGDSFRRSATRAGLRGPVAKAVLRAFDAIENPPTSTKEGPDKTTSMEVIDPRRKRTLGERFGMFAVRRSNDDQMILPFGTDLAKAMEELRDVAIPQPQGGTVQATTFTEPRPTARPHLAAAMKIAAAGSMMGEAFKARTLSQANVKLELASAMQAALPGKVGQKFANRILDASTEAELRQLVLSAHAAYVNLTAADASRDAGAEAERVADLLSSNVTNPIGENVRSAEQSETQKLREMVRQFKSASKAERGTLRAALREQRKLVGGYVNARVSWERQASKARTAELRSNFAADRAKAKERLAKAREEFARVRTEDAAGGRARLKELRRTMLGRLAQLRSRFASDKAAFEKMQADAADLVKSALPTAIQGPILARLPRARTMLQMQRLLDSAQRSLERYNRKVALKAAQKAVKNLAKRRLHPAEDAQFVYMAQSIGVLTDKIPQGNSPAKRRRKIGNAASDLLRQLQIPTNDLETVKAQADGIRDRWRARKDGIKSAWNAQVESAAVQLGSELAAHTKALRRDQYGRPFRGIPALDVPLRFLALGHMDSATAAEFVFGDNSLGLTLLYRDLRNAYNAKLAATHADQDYIHDAIRRQNIDIGSDDLAMMSEGIARSHGRRLSKGFRRITPRIHVIDLPDGGTIEVTEAERIWLLGTILSQYNRSMIDAGAPVKIRRTGAVVHLSSDDMNAIVASATAEERAIYDAMKTWHNSTAQGRVRDRAIERLGYDITVDDYWPSPREQTEAESSAEEFGPQTFISLGMTQERVGGKKPLMVEDAFVEFLRHSWVTAGIAHQSRGIEFARASIDHAEFRKVSDERGWFDYRQHFVNLLNDMDREWTGKGQDLGDRYFDRFLQRLRNRAVSGILGANPGVALMQPLGVMSLTVVLSPMDVSRAMGSGAGIDLSLDAEIRESPMLRQRMDASPISLATGDAGGTPGIYGTRSQGQLPMVLISAADNFVVRVAWKAAKMKAERTLAGATPEAIRKETARIAEEAIAATQPTGDPLHQSAVGREARRNGALSLLTMFSSQLSKNWNMLARSIMRASRAPTPANLSKLTYDVAVVVAANSIGASLVRQLIQQAISTVGGDDDDVKLQERLVRDMIANVTGMIYGGAYLSFLADGIASGGSKTFGGPSVSPVADTMTQFFRGLIQIARSEGPKDEKFWQGMERSMVNFAALNGVPVSPYRLLRKALSEDQEKRSTTKRTPRQAAFGT